MKNKDGIEHTPFTVLTEDENGIIAIDSETQQPLLNLNADDVAGYAMEFLGNILGDDIANLVHDYNANISVVRAQHKYTEEAHAANESLALTNKKLAVEVENYKKVRQVQAKAIESAIQRVNDLTKENDKLDLEKKNIATKLEKVEKELADLKKKNTEQKAKTKDTQAQLNVSLEKIKNMEYKYNSLKVGIGELSNYSQYIINACKKAETIMYATGRFVEADITKSDGSVLRIAKVPLNISGHNNLNVKLSAMGYPVSLTHNYFYTVEDSCKGQQYFFACEDPENLVTYNPIDFTQEQEVRNYLIDNFKKEEFADFSKVDSDTDFSTIAKQWQTIIDKVAAQVVEVGQKFFKVPSDLQKAYKKK